MRHQTGTAILLALLLATLPGCFSDDEPAPEQVVNCLFHDSLPGHLEWHVRPGASRPDDGYHWEQANRTGLILPVQGKDGPARNRIDDTRQSVKIDPLPAQGCILVRDLEPGWYDITAVAVMKDKVDCMWHQGKGTVVEVTNATVARADYGPELVCN